MRLIMTPATAALGWAQMSLIALNGALSALPGSAPARVPEPRWRPWWLLGRSAFLSAGRWRRARNADHRFDMTTRASTECPLCEGARWLCQEHVPLPWKHDACDAPGVPCLCNRYQGVRWLRVFAGASRPAARLPTRWGPRARLRASDPGSCSTSSENRRRSNVADRRVFDRRRGEQGVIRAVERRSGERRHQGRRTGDGRLA